jgi:hypothetical protein
VVTGELRAQRREPCDQPCQYEAVDEECPDRGEHCTEASEWNRCDGCNGDGTRWVTVGTLASAAFYHGEPRSLYVIEEAS